MATTPIEKLRLRRTQQSTIYEAVSAAILLVMWIIGIVAIARHKAETDILIALTTISIAAVLLHLASYRPTQRWVRNDFEIKTVRQAVVASKFYRIFAIEVAMFGLFIAINGLIHFQRQGTRGYKGRYNRFRRIRNAHRCTQKTKEGARSREAGTTAEKRREVTCSTPFIRLMFNTIQHKMRERR